MLFRSGFRIDVCHSIIKDAGLRDNPPATKDDHPYTQMMGLKPVYTACRPEVHDVIQRWRKLADSYDPPRVLIGETYVLDPNDFASFYGKGGDELHLAFNFMMLHADFNAPELREVVEFAERLIPPDAWPVWTGGNHDEHRFPSRWGDDDPRKARLAMVMLMGLRGTPFVYYGDEIGMIDTEIPADRVLDPVGKFHGARFGRDPERTPMQWANVPGAGFSEPGVEPWLPYGDFGHYNVEEQRDHHSSMLTLTRDLIRLRERSDDLTRGTYETVKLDNEDVWMWKRGEHTVVVCNFSDDPVTVPGVHGEIRIGTVRGRESQYLNGDLNLEPWEGVIVSAE